jgi:hypothetical protein
MTNKKILLAKEKFLANIEKNNAIFNNSTKAQKRVMIAQDCIDRLRVNLIDSSRGSFISIVDSDKVNKEIINKTTCVVCAKGGLFASYIGRVNNFNTFKNNITNETDNCGHAKLLEIFTLKQLTMIEYAFEGVQYIHEIWLTYLVQQKLMMFFNKFDNDNERLKAICENIIKNKGTFKI